MADILFLRGAPAFSVFRLQGLQQRIQAVTPDARIGCAEYWHFVRLNQDLSDDERRQLAALLEERPAEAAEKGKLFLVTPRIGTISPWSSKASDIALHCGLKKVLRVERGMAVFAGHADGRAFSAAELAALRPLIHDRMTEVVVNSLDAAQELADTAARAACLDVAQPCRVWIGIGRRDDFTAANALQRPKRGE